MDTNVNHSKSIMVRFNLREKEFSNLNLTLEENKIIKTVPKKAMSIPREVYYGVFVLCVLAICRVQKQ